MQLGESDSNLEGALNVVVTGCRLLQSPFCTAVDNEGQWVTQVRKEHMKERVQQQLNGKSIIFLETATFKSLKVSPVLLCQTLSWTLPLVDVLCG